MVVPGADADGAMPPPLTTRRASQAQAALVATSAAASSAGAAAAATTTKTSTASTEDVCPAAAPPAVAHPDQYAAMETDADDVEASARAQLAAQGVAAAAQPGYQGASLSVPQPPRQGSDVISQLEGDLALLLQIMSSSLHYIANRSAHVQLSEAIPLYNAISGSAGQASRALVDRATMAESIEELTDDLVGKAKDMERRISMLPGKRKKSSSPGRAQAQAQAQAHTEDSRAGPSGGRRQAKERSQAQSQAQEAAEGQSHTHDAADIEDDEEEAAIQHELRDIDEQMHSANNEYRSALAEAHTLHAELDGLLRSVCDDHQAGRARLAEAAASAAAESQSTQPQASSKASQRSSASASASATVPAQRPGSRLK